jgi:hypothetical protein
LDILAKQASLLAGRVEPLALGDLCERKQHP